LLIQTRGGHGGGGDSTSVECSCLFSVTPRSHRRAGVDEGVQRRSSACCEYPPCRDVEGGAADELQRLPQPHAHAHLVIRARGGGGVLHLEAEARVVIEGIFESWGQAGVKLGSSWGQAKINPRSTRGQPAPPYLEAADQLVFVDDGWNPHEGHHRRAAGVEFFEGDDDGLVRGERRRVIGSLRTSTQPISNKPA